jgi:microcompartment protein CcmK/EutM
MPLQAFLIWAYRRRKMILARTVALDAGIGERFLLPTESFSAMTAVDRPNSPIDAAVVDEVDLHTK